MGADDSRGQSIQASLNLQSNGAVPLREGQLLGKRTLAQAERTLALQNRTMLLSWD